MQHVGSFKLRTTRVLRSKCDEKCLGLGGHFLCRAPTRDHDVPKFDLIRIKKLVSILRST